MRNDLLADIVTASGGTITDRNNRNLLLKDWLEAVQAPAVNYVARLNGADQYWQLSDIIEIPVDVDFKLTLELTPDSPQFYVFGDSTSEVDTGRGALFSTTWRLPGISYQTTINRSWVSDDESHTLEYSRIGGAVSIFIDGALDIDSSKEYTGIVTLDRLGGRYGGSTSLQNFGGLMSKFTLEVGGVLTHSIPLTNKAQGATQLATVGNVNATMIGYNNDVWEQV